MTNIEKINIRNLKQDELNGNPYPLVVMDLSFISLKVLCQTWNFVESRVSLSPLVKPQFECTREEANSAKGVIRSKKFKRKYWKKLLNLLRGIYTSSLIFKKSRTQG